MDPPGPGSWEVTIDGLIATIGTTSHGVTNFIRAVRSARADLVHVTRELSDLRLELELLRDEHNVPRQIRSRALAVLDGCGVVLRRIGSLLSGGDSSPTTPSISTTTQDKNNTTTTTARPPQRWSVKERFATSNLCNCLQTYREALTLLPDVEYLRSSKDGAQSDPQDVDTAEVEDKSNAILEAVQDLEEAIPQAEPAISDSRPALELYLTEVANYTRAISNYLIHGSISEPPANDTTPLDHMAPTVNQGMSRASSKHARRSPQQQDARSATASPRTDTSSPAPNGPLEVVGPWFPSEDLPVPFYSNQNQEQLLQHRANSFHVPRSPAPHLPLPGLLGCGLQQHPPDPLLAVGWGHAKSQDLDRISVASLVENKTRSLFSH